MTDDGDLPALVRLAQEEMLEAHKRFWARAIAKSLGTGREPALAWAIASVQLADASVESSQRAPQGDVSEAEVREAAELVALYRAGEMT